MVAYFYALPDGARSFDQLFRMAVREIVSYDYTAKWTGVGEFTLVIPKSRDFIKTMRLPFVVLIDGDWLIADDLSYDKEKITVSGTDAKGILSLRVSAFSEQQDAGTQGYDVVEGTTAQCIKHYIDNNLISPVDSVRAVPMVFSSGNVTGLQEDAYMARLENVSQIVSNLCDGAGVGYEVTVNQNISAVGFVMQLRDSVDRSMEQSERARVIFSPGWGNVAVISFEHDIGNLYNAVFSTGAGVTQCICRSGVPEGLLRRECAIDVSVNTVADIERYTLDAVKDNTEKNSFNVVPLSAGYGSEFFLGDKVTVRDPDTGNNFTAVITQAHKQYSGSERSVEITVGEQKQKLLNRIINNLISGTQKRR